EDNLQELPLHQWGKWIFTSVERNENANAYFREMEERMSWLPFDQFVYRPEFLKDYFVDAHCALYCENYLEGFHIPFVNAGLNSIIDYGSYTTELYSHSSLQLGLTKDDDLVFELPQSSPDYGKKVVGYYFFIFPNMMFNFY